MRLDEPLNDKEFHQLDQFLLSEQVGDEGMTMDALHGFLTAIAIGPEAIPMTEWLPHVWGGPDAPKPRFRNDGEMKRMTGLIARYMNEVQITFEVAPQEYEPLFCVLEEEGKEWIDGETWAWGFWAGMQLRADAWEPAWDDETCAAALRPIYLLGAEEIEEDELLLVDTPEKCHQLAVQIEAYLPTIRRFWSDVRRAAQPPVRREAPKTGRNDPCPCGSGKKFKQCCADKPILH